MPIFGSGAGSGNAAFDAIAHSAATPLGQSVSSGLSGISTSALGTNTVDKTTDSSAKYNFKTAANGIRRTPWTMTTTEWMGSTPKKMLYWAANPSVVTWSMAQRGTHVKNLYGTVLHVWPDNFRNTFFDEFRLSMSLQSGSVMPIYIGGKYDTSPGLDNFYEFMSLVDAPKLTADGRVNEVQISYSSNLFPDLTLYGMFDPQGIKFSDDTANPNQVNSWTAEFVVYRTSPELSSNKSTGNGGTGQLANPDLLAKWLEVRLKNTPQPTQPSTTVGIPGGIPLPANLGIGGGNFGIA